MADRFANLAEEMALVQVMDGHGLSDEERTEIASACARIARQRLFIAIGCNHRFDPKCARCEWLEPLKTRLEDVGLLDSDGPPEVDCTAWQATWCPNHGDCNCPRREDGEIEFNQGESICLLHDENDHGWERVGCPDPPESVGGSR